MSSMNEDDLMKRTVRMVAVLVGSCVVFVGALSLLAVLVTNLAVGSTETKTKASSDTTTTPSTPAKPEKASPKAPAAPTADKAAGNHPI